MNITPINNRINFCAIVLNQTEREKAQSTIAKLQTEPGYEQAGKNNLLQIFDRHIKKEVETRYGQAREKEDYYQTYYTALFEAISDNKSLDDILKEVNKPNVKENIIYSKYFPECPLSKSKMENLTVNDLPVAISSPSQETVLQLWRKATIHRTRIVNTSEFQKYTALEHSAIIHALFEGTKQDFSPPPKGTEPRTVGFLHTYKRRAII